MTKEIYPSIIRIRAPKVLVEAIDKAACEKFMTGSQYIRQVLIKHLKEVEGVCLIGDNRG